MGYPTDADFEQARREGGIISLQRRRKSKRRKDLEKGDHQCGKRKYKKEHKKLKKI